MGLHFPHNERSVCVNLCMASQSPSRNLIYTKKKGPKRRQRSEICPSHHNPKPQLPKLIYLFSFFFSKDGVETMSVRRPPLMVSVLTRRHALSHPALHLGGVHIANRAHDSSPASEDGLDGKVVL